MKRILCIWLPSWPIQRLVVARSELRGRAVMVHTPDARRGRRVVCCSAVAEACGVRVGMPLAEATCVLEKVPSVGSSGLYMQPHDGQADREALEQLAVWCEQFSPVVGLEAADRPSCLLLDVTGLGPLFGSEEVLAGLVLQAFCQRGYGVHLAIAGTVGTAWAVAHFGKKHFGKKPCAGGVPHGTLALVAPGKDEDSLRPLPVEALRLPDQTVQLLTQLGILTLGQLAALPRASFSSRFGEHLLWRWDQATGLVEELIVAHRSGGPLEARGSLEHPTTRREVIDCLLGHLIQHLVQLLGQRNQGALELVCELECVDGPPARIQVGLFRPTAIAGHLMELLRIELGQRVLPGAVHQVWVRATATARLEDQQHQLLDHQSGDGPRQLALARLIDRLSSRLGGDRVVGVRLQADAQVEWAYRDVPLTGARSRGPRGALPAQLADHKLPGWRPLRLRVPPLAVDAIAVVPQGPPVCFVYHGQPHRIAQSWGPERIETGWWRGRSVRRDYYRVEDQQGNRFWLFRRQSDGKWFLHGFFE